MRVCLWLAQDVELRRGNWYPQTQYLEAVSFFSSQGLCGVSMQGGLKKNTGHGAAVHHFTSPARQSERASPLPFFSCVLFFDKRRREEILSASASRPSVAAQAEPQSQMWRDASPPQPGSQGTRAVGGLFVKDVINPWRARTHSSWQKIHSSHLPHPSPPPSRPSCRPVYNPFQYENLCKVPQSLQVIFCPPSRAEWAGFLFVFILKPIPVLKLKQNLKVSSCAFMKERSAYSLWTPEGEWS